MTNRELLPQDASAAPNGATTCARAARSRASDISTRLKMAALHAAATTIMAQVTTEYFIVNNNYFINIILSHISEIKKPGQARLFCGFTLTQS